MRNINLDHLHTLSQVIALGSFSAAAAQINLTQPAVSLQIRQLERRVGLRLVERVGRRAMPTEAGRELLSHAKRIEAALAEALEAMAHRSQGVVGRVLLGTGATACIYLLPPMLSELRRRFPALEIIVRTGNTPEILRLLEENVIDIALVTLPAPGRSFEVTPLLDDEIVAVFPPGTTPPVAVTPSSLAKQPVLVYEPGGNARRVVDEWFREAGLGLKPVMELGNVEAIKQLVGAGLGCGLLPRLAAASEALPAGVVAHPLYPVLRRRLGIVMRRDKVPDRSLREVTSALLALSPQSA
jgi:DNA-binding transcriptional LysR family regulator